MYGQATDYSELIPSAPEIECVFLSAEAEPRSARPAADPDLVVLDLDFVGSRAADLLGSLRQLSLPPTILTVARLADQGGLPAGETDRPEPFARDSERLRSAIEDRFQDWLRARDREGERRERLVIELPPGGLPFEDYERRILRFALERHGWNRSRTARELRISRPRLQRKIEKYGLGPGGD